VGQFSAKANSGEDTGLIAPEEALPKASATAIIALGSQLPNFASSWSAIPTNSKGE
jgi:hypothetical protein